MNQQKQETRLLSVALLLVLSVSLITSLFFKEKWLWMDEVLSYLLISDPSVAHMNDAVVSGMDANPPFFANVYWLIGHTISLDPQFLRAVSVVIFALTCALFYRYVTTLIGTSVMNFVLMTLIISLTYLNFTLATQIRTYSLFLLISFGYFAVLQRLTKSPNQIRLLTSFCLLGLLMLFTHSFGLFYATASGAFFAGLFIWSKDRRYLLVLGAHVLVLLIWLVSWYPSFAIQSEAGKPHSWIPLPTVSSFFTIVGELVPTVSSSLERSRFFQWLPVMRFLLVVGLWGYISLTRLKNNRFQELVRDQAFMFYLMAGFIYVFTIGFTVAVSLSFRSVFISRYLWPNHLLLIYQFIYAFYFFQGRWSFRLPFSPSRLALSIRLLPIYMGLVAVFIFYQNRKIIIFPRGVLSYLPQLNKQYPVFVETADYFLPIWFHDKTTKIRYLLDWETAAREPNLLSTTVEHKILKSVREKYHVDDIMTKQDFTQSNVPHFYVVDESSIYQIEDFIKNGRVQVIRELPIHIAGHRLLECRLRS